MEDLAQPLVIENGSGTMKAGFAGGDTMRSLFPTIIGKPKIDDKTKKNFYIGDDANRIREILSIKNPIERGIITRWDDMEKIWNYTFYDELRVCPEEHPVLLTESPLNPKANREKMTQVMFETFNVPAMQSALSAVLSLYCRGKETGLVVDIGYGVTRTVPIHSSHAIQQGIQTLDFAGTDVTAYLKKILSEKGLQFPSPQGLNTVNDIKETLGCVAMDFEKTLADSLLSAVHAKSYELPDGNVITLSNEHFRCAEAIFRPSLAGKEAVGVHEMVFNSIVKSSEEIRNELYQNIVLSGGSTMLFGLVDRLDRELLALAPGNKIAIAVPSERKYSAYIGGSVMASMSTFMKTLITKAEYDEEGPAIIHKKGL